MRAILPCGKFPEGIHRVMQGFLVQLRFRIVPALRSLIVVGWSLAFSPLTSWADGRKVIVDQDTRGPATSDLQAVALLLQDPSVDLLGVAVVSGDVWRDEGISHALRLLEVTGRTDVPVLPGAVYPLVHTRAESLLWEKSHGAQVFTGAWLDKPSIGFHYHEPTSCRRQRKARPHSEPPRRPPRTSWCARRASFPARSRSSRSGR